MPHGFERCGLPAARSSSPAFLVISRALLEAVKGFIKATSNDQVGSFDGGAADLAGEVRQGLIWELQLAPARPYSQRNLSTPYAAGPQAKWRQ